MIFVFSVWHGRGYRTREKIYFKEEQLDVGGI